LVAELCRPAVETSQHQEEIVMTTEISMTETPAATDAGNCVMNLVAGQMDSLKAIREDRIKWLTESTYPVTPHAVEPVQPHPADNSVSRDAVAGEAK
jgi:hypothetical protein